MTNCVTYPFVGLKGICKDKTPSSGLYVNSITGVSFDRINAIVGDEYLTVEEKYKDIHDCAIEQVKTDFITKLKDKLDIFQVIDSDSVGYTGSNFNGFQGWVGFQVEVNSDDCLNKAQIDSISFYANKEAVKTLYILDGVCLHEKVISIRKGLNKISLFQIIEGCNAEIYLQLCDGLEIGQKCEGNCSCDCKCKYKCCQCIEVREVTKLNENDNWIEQSNGIKINVSCVCDPCEMFCISLNALKKAIQLQIGIKIAEEILVSGETNCFISNGGKSIATRMLLMLQGGKDTITQTDYSPKYTIELGKAVSYAKNMIQSMTKNKQTKGVVCKGLRVANNMP